MNFCRRLYFFFLILATGISWYKSQNTSQKQLSSVEIEEKIDSLYNDPEKAWEYIRFYIQKSKSEKNYETLLYAYRYASYHSEFPNNLKYADSALVISKKYGSANMLTNAYINRSGVYMKESKYQKALDDILEANQLATKLQNKYLTYKTEYIIALNKIYLGSYEDASTHLKHCVAYFKNNLHNTSSLGQDHESYYIYSLMSLIDSNTFLRRQNENEALLKEAFTYIKENNQEQYLPYFIGSEGINLYYTGHYKRAISKLTEAIKLYNDGRPHLSEIFYLGLANWKIGKRSIAVKYLEELDKEQQESNILDPQFRPAYEILIKYNDSLGDINQQLKYIDQLMTLDRSYEKNFKYLYTKINKEYDTEKLLKEKNKIERSLIIRNTIITTLLVITLIFISILVYRNFKLKKKYNDAFQQIISKKEIPAPSLSKEDYETTERKEQIEESAFVNRTPKISNFVVKGLLQQLQDFEDNEEFLNPQLSQKLLSESFGTNMKYLSKIINAYKGKNFNIYINDLRLDYIVELLKNDPQFLEMDVKELAKISGFTSAESFSNNFIRKFELKPSYFIKRMKEMNTKSSNSSSAISKD